MVTERDSERGRESLRTREEEKEREKLKSERGEQRHRERWIWPNVLRIRDLGLVGTASVFTWGQKYASCLEMWVFCESKLDLDLAVKFEGGNTSNTSSKLHMTCFWRKCHGRCLCRHKTLHTRV